MIKESRYLEINRAYLQLNVPLFVLAGLNDILWLFQSEVASTKEELFRELKIYFVLLHIFSPFLQRVWAACDMTDIF